jgi:hypothetical protein
VTVPPRPIESRRRRPRPFARWLAGVAVVVVAFALGVAVGQALEDRPEPRQPVTNISTVRPWTQTTGG